MIIDKSAWAGRRALSEPLLVTEVVTDPAENARRQAQHERGQRNLDWLQAHWGDLLPQAYGKFLAVAGQEAFLADTPQAAWASSKSKHPEDDGAFLKYVRPELGPRIYASHR